MGIEESGMADSRLLWVVLVAVLGVSTPLGAEAPTGAIDEGVALISLAEPEEPAADPDITQAVDYGDDKPANDSPLAYHAIPNFVFQHMSEPVVVDTQKECQAECNRIAKCRSFSWRPPTLASKKEADEDVAPQGAEAQAEGLADAKNAPPMNPGLCLWSLESIHYKPGWVFYTKAKDLDWEGNPHLTTTNFHKFPGLEYQESSYKEVSMVLADCRMKCAQDPKCSAFSFNANSKLCRLAGAGVHYDPAFTYFEKPNVPSTVISSEAHFERNAAILSAQEMTSKKSGAKMLNVNRKKDEEIEKRKNLQLRQHTMHTERSQKNDQISVAEKKLNAEKDHVSFLKSQVLIKQEFDAGYFHAMGMAHEKQTKEVKLKSLELKQKDTLAAKESFQKTGEFQMKKQATLHARKVEDAEIGIQTTKEKIMKISNSKLKMALDNESKDISSLKDEESGSLDQVKTKHQKRVNDLKDEIFHAQGLLQRRKTDLQAKKAELDGIVEVAQKAKASMQSKHQILKKSISRTTDLKIANAQQPSDESL